MSQYIKLILFFILTTSCIIIAYGLSYEGVGSDGESKEGKTPKDTGKKPSADEENPDGFVQKFLKTNVKEGSSSSAREKPMEEQLETTTDFADNDVLVDVCKKLKIFDLMKVAAVCKSWNEIAAREISTRGLERALLPHIFSTEISRENSNFHVYDILNTKPYIALLFVAPSLRERNCENLEDILENHIIEAYKKFFPQNLVTIGVDVSMMDENVITSCPNDSGPPTGILSLLIPLYKDLQINVASCSILTAHEISSCAIQITNDLMLDAHKKNTAIIMFGSSFLGIHAAGDILNSIKSRLVQKSYTLWGGIFDDTLKVMNSKTTEYVRWKETTLFAINLSGSNLKSWSIVVDCRIKKHEFDKKLLKFKNSLKLQHQSIGLACGPRYVEDTRQQSLKNVYLNHNELMDAVKRVFPNIPFIGVFNFGYLSHFGVDSMSDDDNQQLAHPMSLSLMILTHN